MAAAIIVTGAVGAAILTGLNVEIVHRAVERLETFDIRLPEPPPEEPPPELTREDRSPEEEGAAGKKADPTPVVAPKPEIVLPPRDVIAAAVQPGTGAASTSGAASSGTGTGAGGSGTGRGGGGAGAGAGNSPAQLVRNLSRSDYRALAAGRLPTGRAMVSLRVEPSGSPSNCRVVRSSGDAVVDRGLCPLITRRLRFRPARDSSGRPIPYDLQYVATWRI